MRKELDIPVEQLEKLGINIEMLKKNTNAWQALIQGKKTPLLTLQAQCGGTDIKIAAKLHLYETNGEVKTFIHPVRPKVDLKPFKGHSFTEEEQVYLLKHEMLPSPIELELNSGKQQCLVGVDRETREIVYTPVQNVYISEKILGQEITSEEKNIIKNGGYIYKEDLVKDGKTFEAIISYDVDKGGLTFKKPTPDLIQKVRQATGLGNLNKEATKKVTKKTVTNDKTVAKTRTKGKGV